MTPGEELDRDVWVRRAWTAFLAGCLWSGSIAGMWKCGEYIQHVNPVDTTPTTTIGAK